MNARWVQKGYVETGGFCTAQGVIKHVSDISVAIWALVIALHTFLLLFYRVTIPRWAMYTTLVSALFLILLITPLGPIVYTDTNRYGNFYGISGYWCWITDEYDTARITMDYMIMFVSATFAFILYSLVFLRMRGNIVVDGWYIRFRLNRNGDWRGRDFAGDSALSVARQMLLYPIAYTIIILPIAAARFSEWSGHNVPFNVTIFSDVVFLLSGLVNVTLFATTRRLLPAESVIPHWRKMLPWNWNPQSAPQPMLVDAEKSFACRAAAHGGDVEKSLDTFAQQDEEPYPSALESYSSRIKIDNHVDNTLTLQRKDSRSGSESEGDGYSRSSMASSFEIVVRRPQPAVLASPRLVDPFATVSTRPGSVSSASSMYTGETMGEEDLVEQQQKYLHESRR
jgi:hypothetical protein